VTSSWRLSITLIEHRHTGAAGTVGALIAGVLIALELIFVAKYTIMMRRYYLLPTAYYQVHTSTRS